jgi:hypothetical protein
LFLCECAWQASFEEAVGEMWCPAQKNRMEVLSSCSYAAESKTRQLSPTNGKSPTIHTHVDASMLNWAQPLFAPHNCAWGEAKPRHTRETKKGQTTSLFCSDATDEIQKTKHLWENSEASLLLFAPMALTERSHCVSLWAPSTLKAFYLEHFFVIAVGMNLRSWMFRTVASSK